MTPAFSFLFNFSSSLFESNFFQQIPLNCFFFKLRYHCIAKSKNVWSFVPIVLGFEKSQFEMHGDHCVCFARKTGYSHVVLKVLVLITQNVSRWKCEWNIPKEIAFPKRLVFFSCLCFTYIVPQNAFFCSVCPKHCSTKNKIRVGNLTSTPKKIRTHFIPPSVFKEMSPFERNSVELEVDFII